MDWLDDVKWDAQGLLPVIAQDKAGTRFHLPLGEREPQVIVFSPGAAEVAAAVNIEPPQVVPVEGEWEFELAPALDNRFGDYHWPATPALMELKSFITSSRHTVSCAPTLVPTSTKAGAPGEGAR